MPEQREKPEHRTPAKASCNTPPMIGATAAQREHQAGVGITPALGTGEGIADYCPPHHHPGTGRQPLADAHGEQPVPVRASQQPIELSTYSATAPSTTRRRPKLSDRRPYTSVITSERQQVEAQGLLQVHRRDRELAAMSGKTAGRCRYDGANIDSSATVSAVCDRVPDRVHNNSTRRRRGAEKGKIDLIAFRFSLRLRVSALGRSVTTRTLRKFASSWCVLGQDRLRVELHASDRELLVAHAMISSSSSSRR